MDAKRLEARRSREPCQLRSRGRLALLLRPRLPGLFLHWYACLIAGNPDRWPEPPEVCKKLTETRDPAAGERLINTAGRFFPYDPEVLATERRLVPV